MSLSNYLKDQKRYQSLVLFRSDTTKYWRFYQPQIQFCIHVKIVIFAKCLSAAAKFCALVRCYLLYQRLLNENEVVIVLGSLCQVSKVMPLVTVVKKSQHKGLLELSVKCSITYRITRHGCTIFSTLRETIEESAKQRHLWQY